MFGLEIYYSNVMFIEVRLGFANANFIFPLFVRVIFFTLTLVFDVNNKLANEKVAKII
jgi:hypothetical protein